MTSYQAVSDALKNGADPSMLCMTCPWDRYCLTPPNMTAGQIEQHLAKSKADDLRQAEEARARGEQPGIPVGSLLTTLMVAGKDRQAELCPVFSMRLQSPDGRKIVDELKSSMQGMQS